MASFSWDPTKNRINQRKHGVSFEKATRVFLDPLAMSIQDNDPSYGEERWITMGQVDEAILVVAHTEEEDDHGIRIISARKATKHERIWYEKS